MARRGGLGKGLGALIPPGGTEPAAASGGGLTEVAVSDIEPNRYQPRSTFDEESLAELADSIREVGLLQPVLVRPSGDGYELIAGERRWRAARRLGMQTIPALVRTSDDATSLEQALVENVHRSGLSPLEEAAAYQQLIEDFGLTHEEVATRVGRSRTSITNTLRLMQLPPAIQKMLAEGKLAAGHARALLGTPDRAFQEQLAKRVVAEDLSVRAVEEAIRAREGAETPAKAAVVERKLRAPGLVELEELLGDHLQTRVRVTMGSKTGKVTVEFAGLDDLERIYVLMTSGHDDADEQAAVAAAAKR